jgi:hypothetical protein
MKINWDATPLPTYGNFGGQQISGQDGAPVDSLDELFQSHDAEILAASQDAGGLTPQELVQAHANLIGAITDLPETEGLLWVETATGETIADPEATLYAGFTALALSAQIASFGKQAFEMYQAEFAKDGLNLQDVLTDAVRYMKTGLDEVPSEGRGLNGLVQVFENQLADYDFV